MAAKGKTKGIGKDPKLSQLGSRLIHTILREERVAERDLQKKLKDIKDKEHKAMMKLNSKTLDALSDFSLQRTPMSESLSDDGEDSNVNSCGAVNRKPASGLLRPKLLNRRAVSMINYTTVDGDISSAHKQTSEEIQKRSAILSGSPAIVIGEHTEKGSPHCSGKITKSNTGSCDDMNSLTLRPHVTRHVRRGSAPDVLGLEKLPSPTSLLSLRRVNSDVGDDSFGRGHDESTEEIIELLPTPPGSPQHEKNTTHGVVKVPQRSRTPQPLDVPCSTMPKRLDYNRPKSASSPTPTGGCRDIPRSGHLFVNQTISGHHDNQLPPDSNTLRPILRHRPRSASPSPGRRREFARGGEAGETLNVPQSPSSGRKFRSRSPSPSRRGSNTPMLDVYKLPASSPVRAGFSSESYASLRPELVRRQLSDMSCRDLELKSRVDGFIKSLPTKRT